MCYKYIYVCVCVHVLCLHSQRRNSKSSSTIATATADRRTTCLPLGSPRDPTDDAVALRSETSHLLIEQDDEFCFTVDKPKRKSDFDICRFQKNTI